MKTLRSVIQSLNPYSGYDQASAILFRKTIMCDNIKRLKIIGLVGTAINLMLLVLSYQDNGISGLTSGESLLRSAWTLTFIIYFFGVGSPPLPNFIKKWQVTFFYSVLCLSLFFASLITALLSIEAIPTNLYFINLLLIGSFLYLPFRNMILIIAPSLLTFIILTPNTFLLEQRNIINTIAIISFAIVFAQTTLISKLKLLANMQTIMDQKKELEYMMDMDGLTRIPNRRKLESYYLDCRNTPLLLLMIDIDNFKNYNDTYGHLQGDQCLIQVAQCLSEELPVEGMTARYGGEEFVTILKVNDFENIHSLVENIRVSIESLQIKNAASSFGFVTISIGYVVNDTGNADRYSGIDHNQTIKLKDFIFKADQALYQAKENGRNQIKRYQE